MHMFNYGHLQNFVITLILRESVRSLDGKNVAVFLLMAENALEKMKNLVGSDKNPKEAMLKNHQSLRSLFGMDELRNGFFFSESPGCVLKVFFF